MGKFDMYINLLSLGNYEKVNCDNLNRSITSLIKSAEDPSTYISGIKTLADEFKRAFGKLPVRAATLRDDFLCTYIRLYTLVGKEKTAKGLLADIEAGKISGINKDFVSKKLHPLDLKNATAKEISKLLGPIEKKRKELEVLARKAYS